jgi:hypothetical protein
MHSREIRFSDQHQALMVRPADQTELPQAIKMLQLPAPRPVVVLIRGFIQSQQAAITDKLYPPPTRPTSSIVSRPRLIERLNDGLQRKLTLIIFGIELVLRVSQRIDDGHLQARLVHGNGVNLIWAPDRPGWPHTGGNWYEAQQVCQTLDEDGLTPAPAPQHVCDCRRWMKPCVLWLATANTVVGYGMQK